MISFIALITALCGFINEMNFAQTLTAVMGGTVVRYQTTFGLFTFSLGLGAWCFNYAHRRWSPRQLLLISQVVMAALSILSPPWITYLNPLLHPENTAVYTLLCYVPVIAAGWISGLELPALLELAKNSSTHRFSPLAWDYAGMFLASALFPLYLLHSAGVFGVSMFAALLSLLALLGVYLWIPATHRTSAPTNIVSLTRGPWLMAIFVLSFCSFSYELLLAKILGDLLRDETLAYSLGIGFMLIGLGIGAHLSQKIEKPLRALIMSETLLIALGSTLYILFYGTGAVVYAYSPLEIFTTHKSLALLLFAPLPLVVGILTGFELPLCLRLMERSSQNSEDTASGIFMNYLGALVAGVCVPLVLLPTIGAAASLHSVALLNLVLLAALLCIPRRTSYRVRVVAAALSGCAIFIGVRGDHAVEQVFLKTYYYDLGLNTFSTKALSQYSKMLSAIDDVQRETTAYQFIDKLKSTNDSSYFARTGFSLFLNKQQQLDSRYWRTYHESFVHGAANLHKRAPKNVLICGGGDGLLARVLLEDSTVESITLVELDPRMIHFARTDADMLALNHNSLEHPKVHVLTADAYAYLFQTTASYDAIYLDFPYPDTYELSRLYSVELYRAARARLSSHGFLIMDAPIWRYVDRETPNTPAELRILYDTLHAAGFPALFAYGPNEPFIFASPQQTNLNFDYAALPKDLSNATFSNLASLDFLYKSRKRPRKLLVNSIYKPQPFFKQ